MEIPFTDGPEGACTNTVTHKAYLKNAETWAKERPKRLSILASEWTKIKLDWLKGCRMLINDGKKCNVMVDSVDDAIQKLNEIADIIMKK